MLTEEDAHQLMLLSKSGIVRKTPLERLWLKSRALSAESLISAILNEEVLLRIRRVVAQENGIQMELADTALVKPRSCQRAVRQPIRAWPKMRNPTPQKFIVNVSITEMNP